MTLHSEFFDYILTSFDNFFITFNCSNFFNQPIKTWELLRAEMLNCQINLIHSHGTFRSLKLQRSETSGKLSQFD